jgi:hypothetical protein
MSIEIESKSIDEFKFATIMSPDGIRQFSSLLDLCFPVKSGCKFFDDFPIWNPDLKIDNLMRFGVFYGDDLICSCGVRLSSLTNPSLGPGVSASDSVIPVSLIGAVATHPLWRGRGLASLLVKQALSWSEGRGAILSFLWGSEHALYQRLGFELCGEQLRVPLRNLELLKTTDSADQDTVYRGWVPELYNLIQKRPGGLLLKKSDQVWFEAHKNIEWFYCKSGQQLKAYSAYGRGIDLQGIVHEWGGSKDSLGRILKQILQSNPEAQILGPPSIIDDFVISEGSSIREYLCMGKILKPKTFFSQVYRNISIDLCSTNSSWELKVDNRSLGVLTQSQFIKQCFGPDLPLGTLIDLPVTSLWIWGLDAV